MFTMLLFCNNTYSVIVLGLEQKTLTEQISIQFQKVLSFNVKQNLFVRSKCLKLLYRISKLHHRHFLSGSYHQRKTIKLLLANANSAHVLFPLCLLKGKMGLWAPWNPEPRCKCFLCTPYSCNPWMHRNDQFSWHIGEQLHN